ncbi:MAG: serine/threonine-protein kinase, partial [Pseudomonadota bacterium]
MKITGLSTARLRQLQSIVEQLWDAPPEAREVLLDEACSGDPQLRAQVLGLLRADESVPDGPVAKPLTHLALETIARHDSPPTDLQGQQVGQYRVIDKLGEGGMGLVYLGERADGAFEGRVAIKVLRSTVDSKLEAARFRIEQQVLAKLDHRAIARLLDAGHMDDGRAYFIMEWVEGECITAYCIRKQLSLRSKVQLLLQAARALQYAHGKLIIHRDVKPSNLLVDASGSVKLLDFGIAKLLGGEPGKQITESDSRPMTLDYAAPEQIRGTDVTTQTDVYQLGVLLFELLTGTRPFQRGVDFYQLVHQICDVGVPKPSQRSAVPALRGDLDAIVTRATAREASDRYRSMEAFASDLAAYLDGHPVAARRPSVLYRYRRFLTRHPLANAAVVVFVMLLTAWSTTSTMQAEALRQQSESADQTVEFLQSVFEAFDLEEVSGEGILVADLLRETRERLYSEVHTPAVRAKFMLVLAELFDS